METRQCWAHDRDGHRCQKKATHRGDHVWSVTWSDEAAVGAPLIAVFAADEPVPFMPVEQPPADRATVKAVKCVACSHKHDGECRCGCREFIG